MRIMKYMTAAIVGLGLMGMSAQAATVGTIAAASDFFADDGGVVDINHDLMPTMISLGDVFTAEISGDATDGGGLFAFAFTATEDLSALETNSLNPVGGFADITVSWASDAIGTVIFNSLTTAQVIAGTVLSTSFLLGETKFLLVEWSDITATGANLDLRVAAVPIPGAAWLFGTALLGGGFVVNRRRKRRIAAAAA